MKSYVFAILSSLLGLVVAGGAEKCSRPPETGVECTIIVLAKDYSGLDGCGILLQLPDGSNLLATNLSAYAPTARDGDILRIGYEEVDNHVSICMAEKKAVRLTCSEIVGKGGDCPDLVDPYRIAWSKRVMQEMDPRQVEEFTLSNQKAYRFVGKKDIRLYTCTGDLLCKYSPREERCPDLVKLIRDPKVIYIVNE